MLHKEHRSAIQTVFDQKLNRKQSYDLLLKEICIALLFIITLTYMPTSFNLEQDTQFVRTVVSVILFRMSKNLQINIKKYPRNVVQNYIDIPIQIL